MLKNILVLFLKQLSLSELLWRGHVRVGLGDNMLLFPAVWLTSLEMGQTQ